MVQYEDHTGTFTHHQLCPKCDGTGRPKLQTREQMHSGTGMSNPLLIETVPAVVRLTDALRAIAVMDVYTRDGEEPAHELMRRIAIEALEQFPRGGCPGPASLTVNRSARQPASRRGGPRTPGEG